MFEIIRESEMDRTLTLIEKALYRIRNCAEDSADVEEAIETIRRQLDNFEVALEIEINSY